MSGRVTRRGLVGKCSCKVAAYKICGSSCKHCICACNSVKFIDVLARYRGAQSARSKRIKIKPTHQISSRWSDCHRAASGSVIASKASKYNDASMYIIESTNDKNSSNLFNIF